jgi:hypothetical protein
MRFLFAVILLLQSLVITPTSPTPIVPAGEVFQHATTHSIEMANMSGEDAGCSATAVGPHTLLTASHCLIPSHEIQIDDATAKVISIDFDDNDHLLIQVDHSFNAYTPIVIREFVPNEVVHMWGNPGDSKDVYRVGTFQKVHDSFNELLMPVLPGDSGSGVFDSNGNLIGVVSVGNGSGQAGVFTLAFTPIQIAAIQ